MGINMGFLDQDVWGGEDFSSICFKRKFRYLFKIPDLSDEGTPALPSSKAARPNLNFREMNGEHLNETIYYPSKPDWQTINLTLYDINKDLGGGDVRENPVFSWIKRAYNPKACSGWFPSCDDPSIKAVANLELYDGCGELLERWIIEHCWPVRADFGDLDMSNSEVVMVDTTLRYDRAYITCPDLETSMGFSTTIQDCGAPICSLINFEAVEKPDFAMV